MPQSLPSLIVIELAIARQLVRFRAGAGLSLAEMAKALGCSYQQVQKYERGQNRISAARLFQYAQACGVPVAEFYPPTVYTLSGVRQKDTL